MNTYPRKKHPFLHSKVYSMVGKCFLVILSFFYSGVSYALPKDSGIQQQLYVAEGTAIIAIKDALVTNLPPFETQQQNISLLKQPKKSKKPNQLDHSTTSFSKKKTVKIIVPKKSRIWLNNLSQKEGTFSIFVSKQKLGLLRLGNSFDTFYNTSVFSFYSFCSISEQIRIQWETEDSFSTHLKHAYSVRPPPELPSIEKIKNTI